MNCGEKKVLVAVPNQSTNCSKAKSSEPNGKTQTMQRHHDGVD